MRHAVVAALFAIVLAPSLTGCAAIQRLRDPEWAFWGPGRIHEAGVAQNIPSEFEKVDLVRLLGVTRLKDEADLPALYRAYERFGDDVTDRNRVQDEIMRASELRCNVYKTHVRRLQSTTNFTLGSLTTLLGGLGAIFTSVDVARALAGSAGITSGINAEFQQSYFSNLATEVIIEGIETRRQALRGEIVARRAVNGYSVQTAVLDAVRYHGACSVVEGLRQASESIQTFRDPGLSTMKRTLAGISETRIMLDRLQKGEDVQSGLPPGMINGGAAPVLPSGLFSGADSLVLPAKVVVDARVDAARRVEKIEKAVTEKKTQVATPAIGTAIDTELTAIVQAGKNAVSRMNRRIKDLAACDANGALTNKLITLAAERGAATDAAARDTATTALKKAQTEANLKLLLDLELALSRFRAGAAKALTELDAIGVGKGPDGGDPVTATINIRLGDVKKHLDAIEQGTPADTSAHTGTCP